MARVRFLKEAQGDFLNNIKHKYRLSWFEIANTARIHERTLYDWRKNKYQMDYNSYVLLQKEYVHERLPKIEILPEYWFVRNAGRLGGIKRFQLRGNFGTTAGRKRGGMATVLKFQSNRGLAKKVGFIISKEITCPRKCSFLAEYIGIVLGDGSINEYQVRISGNSKTDGPYLDFIKRIANDLFNIASTIALRKKNTIVITFSSRSLVEFLEKCGLKKGNKVEQKADVPGWIFSSKAFIKSCLRGLVDTDGGIYFHTHITKGIKYRNIGLCFTSHSNPLLLSAHRMLLNLGIQAKSDHKRHVFLYSRREVDKYMELVGSHNPKLVERYNSYVNSRV